MILNISKLSAHSIEWQDVHKPKQKHGLADYYLNLSQHCSCGYTVTKSDVHKYLHSCLTSAFDVLDNMDISHDLTLTKKIVRAGRIILCKNPQKKVNHVIAACLRQNHLNRTPMTMNRL